MISCVRVISWGNRGLSIMPTVRNFAGGAALLLMVTACGESAPPEAGAIAAGRADCAVGGKDWKRSCTAQRDGDILTLRNAEGGFRRFQVVSDGRGLIPADGAEQAEVEVLDQHRIEVRVGDDRYRLPATMAAIAP